MTTTITLNGTIGSRFLAQLAPLERTAIPVALAELLAGTDSATSMSIEVDVSDAEQLAAFVEDVLAEGTVQVDAPPILFSPRPGDHVLVARDTLVELEMPRKAHRTWCTVARGTRGRLVNRRAELGRVFLTDGDFARQYAYVSDRSMTRIRAERGPF